MLANQRFTDREGDREADLIVMWPDHGIAVIEVKGGLIHLLDGQWRQPWNNTRGWKRIDPVEQALKAKYALRDYLHEHPSWSRGNPRLVHMVALPATVLDEEFRAPDAPRWLVMDRTDTPHAADRIASALRQVQAQPPPPTKDDVDLIVDCVAGAAIAQRDLLTRLHEREDTCELLSEDQARVLDMVSSNIRVEIRGGAGSGKTWLAVEKARRLAASGKRVALMCYSRGLAEYLTRRVDTFARNQRPAYVGTFHSLGTGWGVLPGTDDDSAYWEQQLPELMVTLAAEQPFFDRFDAIVIDEAQDFAEAWWPAVLAALRESQTGELYVFSDENQRVFARQGRPSVPLIPFDLTENLRNTRQIAGTFSSLTPTLMRARGGSGVPVRFLQCTPDEAVDQADDMIESLQQDGWPATSLALLTTKRRHSTRALHGGRRAATMS
ncbi:MAG: AAA family ATPase [Actinomycetota bacterium]|nr:AAA family ATPase [Actinomycetota bacterium]